MQEEIRVILIDGTNYISPAENIESIRRIHAGKIKSITAIKGVEVTTSKDLEISISKGRKRATN